jgi:hypothetical protein
METIPGASGGAPSIKNRVISIDGLSGTDVMLSAETTPGIRLNVPLLSVRTPTPLPGGASFNHRA